MMPVDAPVLRRGLIREHLVVRLIVVIHAVARRKQVNHGRRHAQVAQQRVDGNVRHIVAEAPAVWPAAGNEAAVAEGVLDFALQHVAAEDAQSRVTRIIRIGRIIRAAPREAHLAGGEIDFDQVGNVDRCDIRAVVRDLRPATSEQDRVD